VTHTIHFTPEARDQLDKLEEDIAAARSPTVAARYVRAGTEEARAVQEAGD